MSLPIVAFLLAGGSAATQPPPSSSSSSWQHGWSTSADMTFADFNNGQLFTDADIAFASQKYRVLSLEKCTGSSAGLKTEEAIYSTAARLKAANPAQKVIFYLATDQQGARCYAFNDEFVAHPEWHLKDDHGNFIERTGSRQLDPTVAAAAEWWTQIPLLGDDGAGHYKGQPVGELIDGVLADSGGYERYDNVSVVRLQRIADAKQAMLAKLQAKLTALNGGIVMANGISMYGGANADPRFPGDHNVANALNHSNAIMGEHTAVFECVNRANNSYNVETAAQDLAAIERAAAFGGGAKTVFVQTWPGLMSTTGFTDGSVFPPGGEKSPRNNADWVVALRANFGFAHALALTIAAPNVFWMYGGYWYDARTGYLPCPDDPSSCAHVPEWFPDLDKPLGAPLGARKLVAPYVWEREFEHASVRLDLNVRNQSKVTFK